MACILKNPTLKINLSPHFDCYVDPKEEIHLHSSLKQSTVSITPIDSVVNLMWPPYQTQAWT